MAIFSLALGDATSGMIGEVRQRLLSNKSSGGTDPGLADDAAITRRLNIKHNYWAAQFVMMKRAGDLADSFDFTLASGVTEQALPSNFMTAFQLYRKATNNRRVPVVFISPRDAHAYTNSLADRFDDPLYSDRFRAYIIDDTLFFAVPDAASSNLAGDYELHYYKYPEELAATGDTPFFPPQFLEIFLADVVASLAADGGNDTLASSMAAFVKHNIRQFWASFVPPDGVTPRRVRDVMGYGRTNRQSWRI